MEYKIIDCDQHVIEPPDLWEKWLPKQYHDKAPKRVKDEDGRDAWNLGGNVESIGLVAAVFFPPQYKTRKVAAKKGGAAQFTAFASNMSRMPTLIAEMTFNAVLVRFPGPHHGRRRRGRRLGAVPAAGDRRSLQAQPLRVRGRSPRVAQRVFPPELAGGLPA